jgi:hypothetical protein
VLVEAQFARAVGAEEGVGRINHRIAHARIVGDGGRRGAA